MQVQSPCLGCTKRRLPPEPDCHNREYCPEWGEFKDKCEAANKRHRNVEDVIGVAADGYIFRHEGWRRSHGNRGG